MATRVERRIKSLANQTPSSAYHKRVMHGRGLNDVCPAYEFCISSILQNYADETKAVVAAAAAPRASGKVAAAAASSGSSAGSWAPSKALLAAILGDKKAPDEETASAFHEMKLSRLLCTSLAAQLASPVVASSSSSSNGAGAADAPLPTRISRLVAEQLDKTIILHSVAAVVADEIAARQHHAVWFVNDEKTRTTAEELLRDVFHIAEGSFCVLSTGSRKALDADTIFGSVGAGNKKNAKQDLIFVLTSPDATRANAMLRDIVGTKLAGVAARFASLRAVLVAPSGDAANKVQLTAGTGATPPPSHANTMSQPPDEELPPATQNASVNVSAASASASSSSSAAASVAVAAKRLHFAVVDGFGSFFALCKLIQNLAAGTKLVVHFSTPYTAAFFVSAFYALTNESDSIFGQGAAGLTVICDAEDYPKRADVKVDGVFITSYEDAVRQHVLACAKRFTAIRSSTSGGAGNNRRAVYISGFGHVPELGAQHAGIFVQAEAFPDLALSASFLFQSRDAVFAGNKPTGYKTFILFVTPNERKHGMVEALNEIIGGTTSIAAAASGNSNGKRRGRNEQPATATSAAATPSAPPPSNTVWSVEELQLGGIVRGATDKGANLSQVLEARELQGLVAKMHALTVAAHEAYRALCLFYNTMAFGRHLAEVELALNRIRPELVATSSAAAAAGKDDASALLAPQLPFFGPKTAAWYAYLRGAALESGRFAEHIDVDALAHRFGLEAPPLLDLRTADTPYRPREDLYRFAKGVDTEMTRGFKKFADEKLPAEQYEEDNYGGGFVDEDE